MAIKKRIPVDLATEAKIEAFGAGAEPSATAPRIEPAPEGKPPSASHKPPPRADDLAKTFLIRYQDEELPLLLLEVAQLVDRSQHATALRAIRRGLEAMKAEAANG